MDDSRREGILKSAVFFSHTADDAAYKSKCTGVLAAKPITS